MKATARNLSKAVSRLVETAEDLERLTEDLETAEENYIHAWVRTHREGLVHGKNDTERRVSEAEQMASDRAARSGARFAHFRAKLWYEVAKMQLDVLLEMYRQERDGRS